MERSNGSGKIGVGRRLSHGSTAIATTIAGLGERASERMRGGSSASRAASRPAGTRVGQRAANAVTAQDNNILAQLRSPSELTPEQVADAEAPTATATPKGEAPGGDACRPPRRQSTFGKAAEAASKAAEAAGKAALLANNKAVEAAAEASSALFGKRGSISAWIGVSRLNGRRRGVFGASSQVSPAPPARTEVGESSFNQGGNKQPRSRRLSAHSAMIASFAKMEGVARKLRHHERELTEALQEASAGASALQTWVGSMLEDFRVGAITGHAV